MERWSSHLGFILAAIGSAVGIGNVWRFSSVLGQNGGGAYLVPYLTACFLCAVPLMVLELSVGRSFRGTVVSSFRALGPRARLIGWFIAGVLFLILSYYLVVTGWTLAFSWFAASGQALDFAGFTSSLLPVFFFLLSLILTALIVSAGIRKGIERITTIFIPFIFVLLIGMAAFAATLPGFQAGVAYLFTPDFSVLLDPLIWSAAMGQAFFSLSVGNGILITYGAYLDERENIPRSSLVITLADISVSLLSGLVIFPVVFTFGLEPSIGAQLAFSTLPLAFGVMPFGRFFALAFFLLLFLAALTSSISMLEVPAAALMESTGWPRRRVSLLLVAGLAVAGLPSALSYSGVNLTVLGLRVLDLLDDTAGTLGLIITAILISLAFSWGLPREKFEEIIGEGGLPVRLVRPLCRYVIPSVLLFALGYRVALNLDFPAWHIIPGIPFPGMPFALLITGAIFGTLAAVIAITWWAREGRWRQGN
jgi:NSS family neurotransmitter:Na+ symporter